jgi:hypothetical protein
MFVCRGGAVCLCTTWRVATHRIAAVTPASTAAVCRRKTSQAWPRSRTSQPRLAPRAEIPSVALHRLRPRVEALTSSPITFEAQCAREGNTSFSSTISISQARVGSIADLSKAHQRDELTITDPSLSTSGRGGIGRTAGTPDSRRIENLETKSKDRPGQPSLALT